MGDVLRALEGPIVPMICAAHDRETSEQCGRTTFCTVNTLWVKVRDAISDAVDSLTLADLAHPLVPAPTTGAHTADPHASGRAVPVAAADGARPASIVV